MLKTKISDIDTTHCRVVLDKAGRVAGGINQGRQVIHDEEKDLYYKIFDKEYCRRENFIKAYEVGFFDKLTPALQSLIVDGDDIVGYVTEAGEMLSDSEFGPVPKEFYKKVLGVVKEKKMFFYDLVPINIIRMKNGELSLIDLESVYPLQELYIINRHNAKVKPQYYFDALVKEFDKCYYYDIKGEH